MADVILTIHSPEGSRQVPVTGDRVTIGRGDAATVRVDDPGLSRLHASIYREGERVWLLDEQSTNGCQVNGLPVAATGKPLADGDKISLGENTIVWVNIKSSKAGQADAKVKAAAGLPLAAIVIVVGAVVVLGVVLGTRLISSRAANRNQLLVTSPPSDATDNTSLRPKQTPVSNNNDSDLPAINPQITPVTAASGKPYRDMSQQERMDFVTTEARRVSLMVGTRPCAFTDQALAMIKKDVDSYAQRVSNGSSKTWGEDLNRLFERARHYAPLIIRSFKKEGVKAEVGLYIAMIESEYGQHCYNNFAGAMGMFQFIPGTARAYGVDPKDRCNPEIMAPAAARYMRERISGFGGDATGVGLAIAGYNRNPDSVRRDLQDVVNSQNKDRNFWTLIANESKLDHWFKENKKYVPKFFAAAIIGENPQHFGLKMDKALSAYEEP